MYVEIERYNKKGQKLEKLLILKMSKCQII